MKLTTVSLPKTDLFMLKFYKRDEFLSLFPIFIFLLCPYTLGIREKFATVTKQKESQKHAHALHLHDMDSVPVFIVKQVLGTI